MKATRAIRRISISVLSIIAISWLTVAGYLWFRQDSMVYPASPFKDMPMRAFGHLQPATLADADGTVLKYAEAAPRPNMPVIIFYHGNGDWVIPEGAERIPDGLEGILNGLAGQGYGVMAAEFRGYAGIPGARSEASIIHDAHSYVRRARAEWPGSPIILWGMSMGAGTAIAVAADTPVDALMLDSPFTSIRDIAQGLMPYIPVSMLLTSPFDSMERLPLINAPVFVMHGNLDTIIPVAMGHKVYDNLRCPAGNLFLPEARHTAVTTDTTGQAADAVRAFMHRMVIGDLHPCK